MTSGDRLPADVRKVVANKSRLEVLAAVTAGESETDADFDRLARLAAGIFGAGSSQISLVGADRQWYKARVGKSLEAREGLLLHASTIARTDPPWLLVPDVCKDTRFAGGAAEDKPPARFFIGVPIVVRNQKIGALSVFDPLSRGAIGQDQIDRLTDLAGIAGSLIHLKDEARVRARTAADLIREQWRHALTLEAGKVGSWVWDIRTGEVVANDIFRGMCGLDAKAPIRIEDVFSAIHPDDIKLVQVAFASAFEEGVDYVAEFRISHSGRWVMSRGRVYQRDSSGNPLVIMGVNIDMTEARESAQQMRILLRELNHRVKNTLAMIQALARQTLRQTPEPGRHVDAFSGRLRTLSEAHVLLSDRDWTGIGLVELIETEVRPYVPAGGNRLVLHGQDVRLPPDQALGLGLILNELASNASLYGALSGNAGQVDISWTRSGAEEDGERVQLVWKERGGPPVAVAHKGLGTRLIERSLDKVLDSSVALSFPADGAEARIEFPVSEALA